MKQVYNSHGRPLSLATKLGSGGEGSVYQIEGNATLVAKIYHSPANQEKAEKLRAMPGLRTDRLSRLTAWPIDILFDKPFGRSIGLLMPKIAGHKDIHNLYGVKSRLLSFPDATWPFLIHAAANVARAFAVIHEHSHVIGDVNHGSVLVSKDGTVKLIDCDSFQIKANGRSYRCEVGVPPYTPPELQGQTLSGIVRTPNHDNFGLAVYIFHLLFMGRHPFSGVFLGAGEMPLEKAIREYRFAYGPAAHLKEMKQPPGTLSLEAVTRRVAKLFELAFSPAIVRPTPDEWVPALNELSKNLRRCQHNDGHYFLSTLAACPWCDIEGRSGIVVFNIVARASWQRQGSFSIATVWTRIMAVPRPGSMPELSRSSGLRVQPSSEAKKIRRNTWLRLIVSVSTVCVVGALVLFGSFEIESAIFCLSAGIVLAFLISFAVNSAPSKKITAAKKAAEAQWQTVEERWRKAASMLRFDSKLQELEKKKDEYDKLPNLKNERLRKLVAERRERQLYKFLDNFRIEDARISNIGASRTATLESFGIETAADVSPNSILAIPGFGPAFTANLIIWRRTLESQFVFNPALGVDLSDLQALDREIDSTRATIEQELQSGLIELGRISQEIRSLRGSVQAVAAESANKLAQAEADWKAKPRSASALVPILFASFLTFAIGLPIKYPQMFKLNDMTSNSQPAPKPQANSPIKPQPQSSLAAPLPLPSQEERAQSLYRQGIAYTKKGLYADAIKAYSEAVLLKPDFAAAYHEMGYTNLKLRKYEESISASVEALKLRPNSADTYNNLGQAYSALDRWDDARKAFEHACVQNHGFAIAYYNLAVAHRNLGDDNSAIAAYKESIRLAPRHAPSHYDLGMLYLETRNPDSAFAEYLVLTSLNKKLAERLFEEINR